MRRDVGGARAQECRVIVDRAITRGEAQEVDARLLLEVVIAPVPCRLFLTREAVTEIHIEQLAAATVLAVA